VVCPSQVRWRSNPGLGAVPKRTINRGRESSRCHSGRVFKFGTFAKCALFVSFAMVVWGQVVLQAQTNCSACWSNLAIHWHGTYNLTVTGSGSDPTCGGAYQVNNSSQGTIDVTNNLGTVSLGSVQGSGTISDTVTCQGTTCTASGSGPLLPTGASGGDNIVEILLNLTNCTYTVLINDVINITETLAPCGNLPSCTVPAMSFASGQAADGIFGTPPYSPLPAFGEPLVASLTYSASPVTSCLGLAEPCSIKISWNIQASFDSPVPPVFTQLPPGGPLGCNPTNLPSDADVLSMVQVNAASGNYSATAAHVDGGSLCLSNRAFTITATDECMDTHATALVAYTWTADTSPPFFTQLPAGGSLGANPPSLPTDGSILAQVGVGDDCTVLSTNVTHVDSGNSVLSNRTFTVTATDLCTNQATTNIVFTWTSGTGLQALTASYLSGAAGGIVISWPANASAFTLQTATNLTPPIGWTAVTTVPTTNGASYHVTNRVSGSARFYRLFK
jgi:hypothetical protein